MHRIRGDRFLVVQRVPDVFAQVWHEAGGGYALEHRDGAVDRHFETTAGAPETVLAPTSQVPPLDLGDDDRRQLSTGSTRCWPGATPPAPNWPRTTWSPRTAGPSPASRR
ncbi:hypothetical protein [Lentzea kentuckyensis]|uniref:hypothetical protein n=1 Tax=Lentzea kentuckyensis TaxID=360086 RepID=UPI001B805429|nr:hypothetical protein [Lentzea kentuckyensis]